MKKCSKCEQLLPLAMFYQHTAKCKSCYRLYMKEYLKNNPEYYKNKVEQNKQYYKKHKLPYYVVYLLPDYNYVGITNNPYYRMDTHKSKYNRNTDNWVEIARYNKRQEALKHEAKLHSQGYEGTKK